MEYWNALVLENLQQAIPPVLVRVVSQQGSAPRTAGARMLVRAEDIAGTVGGGLYEALAIETARTMQKGYLARQSSSALEAGQAGLQAQAGITRFSLHGIEDMDMICGGELCLLFELLEPSSQTRQMLEAAARAEKEYQDFCLLTFLSPLSANSGAGPSGMKDFLKRLPQGEFTPFSARTVYYAYDSPSVYGTAGYGLFEQAVQQPQLRTMRESGFLTVPAPPAEFAPGGENGTADASLLSQGCFFVDPYPAPHVIHIFGGGHVSKALADCLASLSFGIVVLEDREEFIGQERFPGAQVVRLPSLKQDAVRGYLSGRDISRHHGIVIMTRGHAYDREVLAGVLDFAPGYLGMIGSKRKWVEVKRNLLAAGISKETLEAVYTPIGISIGAETPEEIAVSIAAELIAWRRGVLEEL